MNASKLNFFGQGSTLDVLMEWERHATLQRIECPYASSCQVATVYIECGTCNETGITGKQKSHCCCHLLRFAQPLDDHVGRLIIDHVIKTHAHTSSICLGSFCQDAAGDHSIHPAVHFGRCFDYSSIRIFCQPVGYEQI